MRRDELAWLCSELGLPAVVESEQGLVANRAAVAAGCDVRARTLETALQGLTHSSQLPNAVTDALARARAGEHAVAMIAGDGLGQRAFRVLASPSSPGCAQVVLAPSGVDTSLEVSRRASLVDVAAAVSHEVANAVGAIAGWAQLASAQAPGVSVDEALRLIASCARTAQEAARTMLSLARGDQVEEDSAVQLSELSDELLTLLSLTARQQRVSLSGTIEPDVQVRGSRAQIFTVLWNLTKNAIEACQPGGAVAVSLRTSGERILLEVSDSGVGLDPAALAHIFAPYYTTKEGGTGLGLALVRKTVADLGGEVTVHSQKGRGTTFRVSIPRLQRHSRVAARPGHASHPPSGTSLVSAAAPGSERALVARILVVDDDDALREMIATALSLRGATVVTARSGEEARAAEGRFDIALIDMMLDGCRGDELLAALRRRGTVTAAMLVTGTVQKPRIVPGGEPDDWVRKPFEVGVLVERIRRTLDRHKMLNSAAATSRR